MPDRYKRYVENRRNGRHPSAAGLLFKTEAISRNTFRIENAVRSKLEESHAIKTSRDSDNSLSGNMSADELRREKAGPRTETQNADYLSESAYSHESFLRNRHHDEDREKKNQNISTSARYENYKTEREARNAGISENGHQRRAGNESQPYSDGRQEIYNRTEGDRLSESDQHIGFKESAEQKTSAFPSPEAEKAYSGNAVLKTGSRKGNESYSKPDARIRHEKKLKSGIRTGLRDDRSDSGEAEKGQTSIARLNVRAARTGINSVSGSAYRENWPPAALKLSARSASSSGRTERSRSNRWMKKRAGTFLLAPDALTEGTRKNNIEKLRTAYSLSRKEEGEKNALKTGTEASPSDLKDRAERDKKAKALTALRTAAANSFGNADSSNMLTERALRKQKALRKREGKTDHAAEKKKPNSLEKYSALSRKRAVARMLATSPNNSESVSLHGNAGSESYAASALADKGRILPAAAALNAAQKTGKFKKILNTGKKVAKETVKTARTGIRAWKTADSIEKGIENGDTAKPILTAVKHQINKEIKKKTEPIRKKAVKIILKPIKRAIKIVISTLTKALIAVIAATAPSLLIMLLVVAVVLAFCIWGFSSDDDKTSWKQYSNYIVAVEESVKDRASEVDTLTVKGQGNIEWKGLFAIAQTFYDGESSFETVKPVLNWAYSTDLTGVSDYTKSASESKASSLSAEEQENPALANKKEEKDSSGFRNSNHLFKFEKDGDSGTITFYGYNHILKDFTESSLWKKRMGNKKTPSLKLYYTEEDTDYSRTVTTGDDIIDLEDLDVDVKSGEPATIPKDEKIREKWLGFTNGLPATIAEAQDAANKNCVSIQVDVYNGSSVEKKSLKVHKKLAEDVQEIFKEMAAAKFPVVQLGGLSVRTKKTANGKSSELSNHSYGTAVDINWDTNPLGAESASDSSKACSRIAPIWKAHGWRWGGDYKSGKDIMHFEYLLR